MRHQFHVRLPLDDGSNSFAHSAMIVNTEKTDFREHFDTSDVVLDEPPFGVAKKY